MEYITIKQVAERMGWSYHRVRNNIKRNKNNVQTDGLAIMAAGSILCKPEIVERLNG